MPESEAGSVNPPMRIRLSAVHAHPNVWRGFLQNEIRLDETDTPSVMIFPCTISGRATGGDVAARVVRDEAGARSLPGLGALQLHQVRERGESLLQASGSSLPAVQHVSFQTQSTLSAWLCLPFTLSL